VHLYNAVEQGVPTSIVILIAAAFGGSRESVMDLIGVSETTFRRNEEANKPLPEVAGHRVMAFLRIVAMLQRLLDESGDPDRLTTFDLESWVKEWMREPLRELDDKTPADMLRNPEGQRAVEQLLERMRGGVPA
jgi:putative toxin-antitoxin system antitoxin component (TIGR02293 family)